MFFTAHKLIPIEANPLATFNFKVLDPLNGLHFHCDFLGYGTLHEESDHCLDFVQHGDTSATNHSAVLT